MYKISDIISMPVISIFESEYLGTIYNVLIDSRCKKVKYFCILNEEDNIPRIIHIEHIYKIGSDVIFIKNKSELSLQINCDCEMEDCANPINISAYNFDGKKLGTVSDSVFNTKGKLEEFIINNKSYKITDIFNVGSSAIIVNNKKCDIKKFKPSNTISPTLIEEKVISLNKPTDQKEEPLTNKIITDFRFLTGRRLNKDIVSLNGEIIARSGATITKELINKASSYGKLVEIARYSTK